MSRTSIGIALMITAALVVLIVASAGPAAADDSGPTVCDVFWSICLSRCDPSRYGKCMGRCFDQYKECQGPRSEGSNLPPAKTTNPNNPPPKGIVGVPPITGGGIKDPGGGGSSPTKPMIGLEPISPSGPQKSGDGGSGSGTTTIYRTHTSHGKK